MSPKLENENEIQDSANCDCICGLSSWLVTGGIFSDNPTMMCCQVFDCMLSDIAFLSCISSDVIEDKTVIDYCADPKLVDITEHAGVTVNLPSGKVVSRGN